MKIALELNMSRLRFDPVNGRRALWLSVTVLRWTIWLQWWDTDRAWGKEVAEWNLAGKSKRWNLFRSLDRLMCATAGVRTSPIYL